MLLVQKMDLIFVTMHGKEISEAPLVIKTLFDNVRRTYPDVPADLVLKYARFRTSVEPIVSLHVFGVYTIA